MASRILGTNPVTIRKLGFYKNPDLSRDTVNLIKEKYSRCDSKADGLSKITSLDDVIVKDGRLTTFKERERVTKIDGDALHWYNRQGVAGRENLWINRYYANTCTLAAEKKGLAIREIQKGPEIAVIVADAKGAFRYSPTEVRSKILRNDSTRYRDPLYLITLIDNTNRYTLKRANGKFGEPSVVVFLGMDNNGKNKWLLNENQIKFCTSRYVPEVEFIQPAGNGILDIQSGTPITHQSGTVFPHQSGTPSVSNTGRPIRTHGQS